MLEWIRKVIISMLCTNKLYGYSIILISIFIYLINLKIEILGKKLIYISLSHFK